MGRNQEFLDYPPDHLENFPTIDINSDDTLYRIHQHKNSPWWFGNTGEGRFDLQSPHGTCYLTTDPFTALTEILGPLRKFIPASFLHDRIMSTLHIPTSMKLANLSHTSINIKYGITREIFTTSDYVKTQSWAQKLSMICNGIRYQTRFTTSNQPHGIALFHPEGQADWPTSPHTIPLKQLAEQYGYTIIHPPYNVPTQD